MIKKNLVNSFLVIVVFKESEVYFEKKDND